MMRKLTPLPKAHSAHGAAVRLLARVRVFMLVPILLQAEALAAVAALDLLLRVVLFVVALQRELSRERSLTALNIALKNGQLFR